jgi:hypothetical protein
MKGNNYECILFDDTLACRIGFRYLHFKPFLTAGGLVLLSGSYTLQALDRIQAPRSCLYLADGHVIYCDMITANSLPARVSYIKRMLRFDKR